MSRYRKLVWNEGMLLSPHHFQQWDNYYEELLISRFASVMPYEWGVLDIQANNEAIANGSFDLVRCRAVMPDGLVINIPETDPAPAARAVQEHFDPSLERLPVHLAVPAKRAGAINFQQNGGAPDQMVRYSQTLGTLPDETTGENDQQLAFARSNLRLLFGDELQSGYTSIKIAELERTPTGHLKLAENYIPPALNVRSSLWLENLLRQLVEILVAKSSSLGEQRRQRTTSLADFTTSEVAVFWLLHTVNSAVPTFAHLFHTGVVHPERLYVAMAELAGKLMTFTPDRHPKNIVRYEHLDLYGTFSRLGLEIRDLLETVIPTRCVPIPLERVRESLYAGRVTDDRLLKEAGFFLGLRADIAEVKLIERVPRVIKIASRDTIDVVIQSALPGVTLTHASPPPAPIPTRPKFHYFALDTNGVFWERIAGSKALAVWVPEEFKDEMVEMYAVKP
ncbi:MAG TPA: type VI secretion system baseplate subunit TssK [Pyrinomonadaceae bacterium]|nr:type VI secretion system baseplate subunit TssK [Pyrinomonadaceae bacterium]